jgi:hypothetical protein
VAVVVVAVSVGSVVGVEVVVVVEILAALMIAVLESRWCVGRLK